MNQRDEQPHEDIARRLRETGIVPAPEDVQEAVMRQVRAESGTRTSAKAPARVRKPASWWRQGVAPALAFAAAAVVVVAAVVVASNGGGSSSGGGSSAGGAAAGGATIAPSTTHLSAAQAQQLPHSRVYRVPESVARSLLGPSLSGQSLPSKQEAGVILVPVPRNRFDALKTLLKTAASEPPVNERHLRIRLLRLK